MSNEPLEPLDPELSALLDVERAAQPPAASLARVWARVEGLVPPGGGGGEPGDGGGGAAGGSGWLASHAVHLAAGTFVVGALAGATAHAVFRPPTPERIVYVERPAAPAASVAPTAVAVEPLATPGLVSAAATVTAPSPTTSPPASRLHLAPSASAGSTLSAERGVLDDARAALGAGDPGRAIALLDEHARRFPKGQLAEESEALTIQALVAQGRFDAARSRAARFRAAAPNSLFLPAIDASLASIP